MKKFATITLALCASCLALASVQADQTDKPAKAPTKEAQADTKNPSLTYYYFDG